jgi:hemin uptake protein HemP
MANNLNENCFHLQKDHEMTQAPQQTSGLIDSPHARSPHSATTSATRIKSEDLFRDQREIEIEHQGRIYRLRVTQLNKLILTA